MRISRAAWNSVVVSLSVVATAILVLTNKQLLRSVVCGDFSACALTLVHNLVTFAFTYAEVLYRRQPSLEESVGSVKQAAPRTKYLLVSCLSATSLISSNVLLNAGSVLFHQLARVVCMPAGACVDVFVEGRSFSVLEASLMLSICLAAAFIVTHDQHDTISGHSFVAVLFISSYVATASCVRRTSRVYKLSSADILRNTLPYTIVLSALWLWLIFAIQGGNDCAFSSFSWLLLSCNCSLAIAVQFLSTWTMKEVSVGLYAIIGQVKTSTTVMFGSFFLGEEVSASASFAFILIIALGGVSTIIAHSDLSSYKSLYQGMTFSSVVIVGVLFSQLTMTTMAWGRMYEHLKPVSEDELDMVARLVNFSRFEGYTWSGLHQSNLSTLFAVSEYAEKYVHSNVHKYRDCPLPEPNNEPLSCWFLHENVCVDGENNVKYLPSSAAQFMENASSLLLNMASGPLLPAELSLDSLPVDGKIRVLHGKTIMVHCWRSPGHNPVHFIFGYGALYSAFVAEESTRPFDHVFHQCPQPHLNGFFRGFWEVLLMEGYERQAIDDATTFHVVSDLSLVCMENVIGNEWAKSPFFGASEMEWDAWRRQLTRYLDIKYPEFVSSVSLKKQSSLPKRIVIFQRIEAANGLRKYLNLPDVLQLVSNFTEDFEVITTTSETTFTQGIELFNSFDILITPHGSHLAKLLLLLRRDVAVIETVGVCMNTGPMRWFGRRIGYIISSGHSSDQDSVQSIIDRCVQERDSWCFQNEPPGAHCDDGRAEEVMRSDLIVDLQRLQNDIKKALQFLGTIEY